MSQLPSTSTTLESHAALACRLVRSGPELRAYCQWLSQPTASIQPPRLPDPWTIECIDSLMNPLREASSLSERRETERASQWIASICECVFETSGRDQCGWAAHQLAAGLLPLYRALATSRLGEGFKHSRRRLSETMILLGLVEHLGVHELLHLTVNAQVSPHHILKGQTQIDLSTLEYLVAKASSGFDGESARLGCDFLKQTQGDHRELQMPSGYQAPDWAAPQTLWTLSNELMSARSELNLPRSWIDSPVPWGKILEHWRQLEYLLRQNRNGSLGTSRGQSSRLNCQADSEQRLAAKNAGGQAGSLETLEDLQNRSAGGLERIEAIDRILDRELQDHGSPVAQAAADRRVVPKILIAEVSGLEDPAFLAVIKRRVAVSRSEARSVCLSLTVVLPDTDLTGHSMTKDYIEGLNRWQQKLVNWLADHPSMKNPVAFMTSQGQLIVAELDVERSEMTTILRQGLIEVLTGKADSSAGTLAQVNVPARFHVGIASTAAPSASFDPQVLIDAAARCLNAAERLGKASIKSIEVY